MSLLSWKLHGNGKSIKEGGVVNPDERLAWPLTIGVGIQHIAAPHSSSQELERFSS
jgi:NCS2 family nucleobase:cation symporter-2